MKNKENYIKLNTWIEFVYPLKNKLLDEYHISQSLENLFNDLKDLNKDYFIIIQFKVRIDKNNIRSISYLQTIKLSEYKDLLEIFIVFWNMKRDNYHTMYISDIIFMYRIVDSNSERITSSKIIYPKITRNQKVLPFGGYNLPNTMDYVQWGEIIYQTDQVIVVKKNKVIFNIVLYEHYSIITVIVANKTLFQFEDYLNNKADLSTFTRVVNKNQTYIFVNGELKLKTIHKKVDYLKIIHKSLFISDNFITMDLETRNIKGTLEPFCISIYDGKVNNSFYLSDYKDSDHMLEEAIKYLMKRKYDQHKVYLHNFSYFDGIFILGILTNLSDSIYPTIREDRLIDVRFKFSNNDYILYFRDSLLMLPSKLKKLAKNFDVENKGLFPYSFANEHPLDYKGKVPTFNYFEFDSLFQVLNYMDKVLNRTYVNNIFLVLYFMLNMPYTKYIEFISLALEEYDNYSHSFKNKQWHLKEETIKYCKQDCRTLHQVMNTFNRKIFELFRLDIHKYPTLSSLAFGIYRSNFYKKEFNIPLIQGGIYDFITLSYTGGTVDVYKPYGVNIRHYDVNSLYPYVMKTYPMPIGQPIQFEGDIWQTDPNAFGFFEVKVTTPKCMTIPVLQNKVEMNHIIKTMSPLGTWTGVYFSEEIKYAMTQGYQFEILRGYLFERKHIFSDYVDALYDLKLNSQRDSSDYVISKLLLNSLYGRFGMHPEMVKHQIITSEETIKFINKYELTNILKFKNGKELVSFFDSSSQDQKRSLNISIPIASAVTSYARIHMNQLKSNILKVGGTVYYTDTDSISTNLELETLFSEWIGDKLGQLKLEHVFKEAVYLAPKVYGGFTDSYEYIRIKGLKNPISFNELKSLLVKDKKLEVQQHKWYKHLSEGYITIKDEIYTLGITANKRQLIYNSNNEFIDTKPITLKDGELIVV